MSGNGVVANVPNLISLGRLFAVPITVWLILDGSMAAAFWLFFAACISDAVDGFIAKKFRVESVIGGFLDPIADKALLVSVYITFGQAGYVESWLVILVVFRDMLILAGAYLFHLLTQNLVMQPLVISKVNTATQFAFAAAVLAFVGFGIEGGYFMDVLKYLVAATTVASGGAYVVEWSRRATAMERDG